MNGSGSLASIDIAIIAVYLTAMLGLGIYFSLRTKNSDDYLLGGRRMSFWSVGLSLFASLLSTISFLGWPGEIIKHGPLIFCQILVYPIIFLFVGRWLIPVIMRQPVTSGYEILEKKLGSSTRYLGSAIFLSLRLLWMAVVVYATTDKVLVPVFHLSAEAAPWVSLAVVSVTVVYSVLGGLRAVVTTDVVQTLVLLSGAIATLALITYRLGGVDQWWPDEWLTHWSSPRIMFHTSERSVAGFMLAMTAWYICTAGADQMAIQRYLATRDARTARRVLGVAFTVEACSFIFMAMIGLALLAWFTKHPEWLAEGESTLNTPDKLFPRFILRGLPVGVSGLIIAGLLAAAMSSLSSGISAAASVIVADFVGGVCGFQLQQRQKLIAARIASAAVGGVAVVLAIVVGTIDANLYELTSKVANLMTAPLFVLFFMAIFVPRANAISAWIAAATAVAVAVYVSFFENVHGLGFLWIVPASLASGAVAGVLASFVFSPDDAQTNLQ